MSVLNLLELSFIDWEQEVNVKITHVYQENRTLKMVINSLEKRLVQLEEQPKRKGLFGRKN